MLQLIICDIYTLLFSKFISIVISRLLATQAERALDEAQQKLARKEIDVRNLEEKVMVFERRIAELTDATQTDADEMVALKTTVTSLDKEKDILQGEVDDKAERLAALQQQLTSKVSLIFY